MTLPESHVLFSTTMNKHSIYSTIGSKNFTHRIFDLIDEHLLSGSNEVKMDTYKMMENLVFEFKMLNPDLFPTETCDKNDTQ